MENQSDVAYETPMPVLFSTLMEQQMGLALRWKAWKPRVFSILVDGTLVYRRDKDHPIRESFLLKNVKLTLLAKPSDGIEQGESDIGATVTTSSNDEQFITNPVNKPKDFGVSLFCQTVNGNDTYIRFVSTEVELEKLKLAIKRVAIKHNLNDKLEVQTLIESKKYSLPRKYKKFQSTMRATIAGAMDAHDLRSRREYALAKRGALKFLPVLFGNDLIHGAWWLVFGSIMFTLSSAIVLYNSYFDNTFGEDDSLLNIFQYRASWLLLMISGFFFTLGSLAYVRALHEDPPMRPLFKCYHFSNDELVGSWMFFVATLPLIPYSLLYISASHEGIVYLGMLVGSIFVILGTLLFVRASYPSEKRSSYVLPITIVLFWCCCSERWLKIHLANDWLAGWWVVLWASTFAVIATVFLFLVALAEQQYLLVFIFATGLVENIAFMIGSAYFVAGSYPENSLLSEVDGSLIDYRHFSDMNANGPVNPLLLRPNEEKTVEIALAKNSETSSYIPPNIPESNQRFEYTNHDETKGDNNTERNAKSDNSNSIYSPMNMHNI
eukprot:gene13674-18349_t